MENQNIQQQETSDQAKKGSAGKKLPKAGLVLGIIATAFDIIWLTKFTASPSRLSSSSEIAAQREFQDNLEITLEDFQQKVEASSKESERKSDSILKETEQRQGKFIIKNLKE